MIFSVSHNFIFVANYRSGSTSVEDRLLPYATLCGTGLHGKHLPIGGIRQNININAPVFTFGVVREPGDWVRSLRDYCQCGSVLKFLEEKPLVQGNTQSSVLATADERLDLLIPFNRLEEGFARACDAIGIERIALPRHNSSQSGAPLTAEEHDLIVREYATDVALYVQACKEF